MLDIPRANELYRFELKRATKRTVTLYTINDISSYEH